MKNFIIVLIIMIQGLSAWSLLWDKTYPDAFQNGASIQDVAIDNNHNVYVTGYINYATNGTIVTIKYNQYGDMTWSKGWGITNWSCQGWSICLDADTNPCVAGMANQSASNYKLVIIKYNRTTGDTLWLRYDALDATDMGQANVHIAVDNNKNIYVASKNGVKCWLVKYNSSGTRQWGRSYQYGNSDGWRDMCVSNKGYIYCAGTSVTGSTETVLAAKYDTLLYGDTIWVRKYSGASKAGADAIDIDNKDNLYILGTTPSDYSQCIMVLKYDSLGNVKWDYHHFDSCGPTDIAVYQPTGESYITGWRYNRIFTFSLSADSHLVWKDSLGDGSQYAQGNEISVTGNCAYVGGYCTPSSNNSDMITMCYTRETGRRRWVDTVGITANNESSNCLAVNTATAYTYIGSAGNRDSSSHYKYKTLLYSYLETSENPPGHESDFFQCAVFPSITHDNLWMKIITPLTINVAVKLYDANGRLIDIIYNGPIKPLMNNITYSLKNQTSGVYFITSQIDGKYFHKAYKVIYLE
jgi:hypothetical protein